MGSLIKSLIILHITALVVSQKANEMVCEKGEKLTQFSTKYDKKKDKRTFDFDCEPMHMSSEIKPKCRYQTKAVTCAKGQIEGCRVGSWLAGYGELDIGTPTPVLVSYCCRDKNVVIEKCSRSTKKVNKPQADGEKKIKFNKVYQGQECIVKKDSEGQIQDIIFRQEICSYTVGGEKPKKGTGGKGMGEKGMGKGESKGGSGGGLKELGACTKKSDCDKNAACVTNSEGKGSCVCRFGKKCGSARKRRQISKWRDCNYCFCNYDRRCLPGETLVSVRRHHVEVIGVSTPNPSRRLCLCDCMRCR